MELKGHGVSGKAYGQELILDLHQCGNATMDVDIQGFCEELVELVDMQAEDFHIWKSGPDEEKDPKIFGVSAIQFITTSDIRLHVLPLLQGGTVYLNLFSCKPFDADIATKFVEQYFEAKECRRQVVERI